MADDDARQEAERRWPATHTYGTSGQKRDAFVAGAEWQAARPTVACAMEGDGLCNYFCEGCSWRYAHVGKGNPDDIAWRAFEVAHAQPVTVTALNERDAAVRDMAALRALVEDIVTDWGAGTVHRPTHPAYTRLIALLANPEVPR